MAAGFTVTAANLDALRSFLTEKMAASNSSPEASDLAIDSLVSAAGATAVLVEDIGRAGPFGSGNPEPVLVAPDLRLAYADLVNQSHVRLRLEGADGTRLNAIAFRAAATPLGKGILEARGGHIHVAGTLRADRWNGESRVQLQLEDAAPAAP